VLGRSDVKTTRLARQAAFARVLHAMLAHRGGNYDRNDAAGPRNQLGKLLKRELREPYWTARTVN
jgi:hypothetical protein